MGTIERMKETDTQSEVKRKKTERDIEEDKKRDREIEKQRNRETEK